jgi:hypothetical protein
LCNGIDIVISGRGIETDIKLGALSLEPPVLYGDFIKNLVLAYHD